MKKKSQVEPLTLLREFFSEKKLIKLQDQSLIFKDHKLSLNTPTGKFYALFQL